MTTRRKKLNAITMIEYFQGKGRAVSEAEYVQDPEAPVKTRHLRKIFGSWARMLRALEMYDPEAFKALSKRPSALDKMKAAAADIVKQPELPEDEDEDNEQAD